MVNVGKYSTHGASGIYYVTTSSPSIGSILAPKKQVLSDPRSRAEYDAELRTRGVEAGSIPGVDMFCFAPADEVLGCPAGS